jgi:hypothetical protein
MIQINENNEIEVYNVIPIYRGNRTIKYLTSVSIKDIIDIYGRLEYDNETQRGERVKKTGRNSIRIEKIMDKKNIEEMKEKIVNDFFDGSSLMWNVRIPDIGKEKEVLEFVPLENKIIIKSPKITLPDSSQRHRAIYELKDYTFRLNQSEYCFPLSISLYTFTEEQSLFSEINGEGTKASKTRSLYLSNQYKSVLVKEIIKESKLNGNVELQIDSTTHKDKVVTFSVLYNSIFGKAGAYRDLKEEDMREFKKWMIKFYDLLVDTRMELGKLNTEEREIVRKTSLINSTVAWGAYAQVSREVMNDTNWKRRLSRLDAHYKAGDWQGDLFSYNNPIWRGTICTINKQGDWKLNNSSRSQSFFTDILKKHLNIV